MSQSRAINPLFVILPVVCLLFGAVVVWWVPRSLPPPEPTAPSVGPVEVGEAPAPAPASPVPPAPAPSGASSHAALEGVVVDASGVPVPGIHLELEIGAGVDSATTLSSTSGTFRFSDLLPGPCRVRVEVPGYARSGATGLNLPAGATLSDTTVLLVREAPIHGQVRAHLTGEPLAGARLTATLHAADQRRIPRVAEFHQAFDAVADASGNYVLPGLWPEVHYDLAVEAGGYQRGEKAQVAAGQAGVDFVLSRGGGIAGTAILAESGEPASGARITGLRSDLAAFTTRADEDGRFHLSGLPRGVYGLDAELDERFFAVPAAELEGIAVEVGRTVEGVTVELAKGGSLSGRVSDRRDDEPIFGAVLELSSAWGRRALESDAAGRFRFTGLRNGDYRLEVAAIGYAATAVYATIADGSDAAREIHLSSGRAIAGFVKNPQGGHVPGARVRYARQRPNDLRFMGGSERFQGEAVSDATGYFRYEPLEFGVYSLLAEATGFAPGRAEGIETGQEEIELLLTIGGHVAGRVTSTTGEPLPELRVNAVGAAFLNGGRDLSGGLTRTDAGGHFRFQHLEPGNYLVSVEPPRRPVSQEERADFEQRRQEFQLRRDQDRRGESETLMRSAAQPSERQVHVLSDSGEVRTVRGENVQEVLADPTRLAEAEGAPSAPRLMPAGTAARGAGGPVRGEPWSPGALGGPEMRSRQVVAVKENETTIANFGAADGVTLKVTVTHAGRPVPSAWVGLSEGAARDVATVMRTGVAATRSSDGGVATLSGLSPGASYHVYAARDQRTLPVHREIELPESGEKAIAIALPEGGVSGAVVDGEGQPVRGANVTLVPRDAYGGPGEPIRFSAQGPRPGASGGVVSDGAGRFRMDEVPEGEYFARAAHGRRIALVPVEVRGDRRAEVRITLTGAGSLEGRITGTGIAPDQSVSAVFFFRDTRTGAVTPVLATRNFAGGQYRLDHLAPGTYDVTCLVYARDGVLAPQEGRGIVIRDEQTTRHNFAMHPGVVVRLSVFDETGLPLQDPQVEVRDGFGNAVERGVAGMETLHNTWMGAFQRRHYTLRVSRSGYREARLELDLSESDASVSRSVVLVSEKVVLPPPPGG